MIRQKCDFSDDRRDIINHLRPVLIKIILKYLVCKSNKTQHFSITMINWLTKSVAPEPEGSSPYSQEPTTGPYLEPTKSTSPPPTPPQPSSARSILIPSSHDQVAKVV
jgi:hypothetical protein